MNTEIYDYDFDHCEDLESAHYFYDRASSEKKQAYFNNPRFTEYYLQFNDVIFLTEKQRLNCIEFLKNHQTDSSFLWFDEVDQLSVRKKVRDNIKILENSKSYTKEEIPKLIEQYEDGRSIRSYNEYENESLYDCDEFDDDYVYSENENGADGYMKEMLDCPHFFIEYVKECYDDDYDDIDFEEYQREAAIEFIKEEMCECSHETELFLVTRLLTRKQKKLKKLAKTFISMYYKSLVRTVFLDLYEEVSLRPGNSGYIKAMKSFKEQQVKLN